MSISTSLRTATRSAYRDVLRAAATTFAGIVYFFRYLSSKLIAVIGDLPVLQGYYFSRLLVTTSRPYSC